MLQNWHLLVWLVAGISVLIVRPAAAVAQVEPRPVAQARQFIAAHETIVRPLEKALNLASWKAQITGKDEDYTASEEAQNRLDAALADTTRFARLKQIRQDLGGLAPKPDPLVTRQIEVLFLQHLEKQVDPALLKKISAKSNSAQKTFNTYRPTVNGRQMADSEVAKALKESRDSAYLRSVWEASKGVGALVEADLKDLVKVRNEAAKKMGFANYYDMALQLNEQTPQEISKLFDQLDELTREPFRQMKVEIDAKLAHDCGITVAELRPWHYRDRFFQEPPAIYSVNFDTFYEKADILKLSRDFYAGIGLPVDAVIARSDLYEKPGKYPHAQCTDIDYEGDVRVMANIVPNEYWMGAMLHELGHSVYSTPNIPLTLPYVLRQPAHIFTTEGVAMLMERFARRGDWIAAMGIPVPDMATVMETGAKMHRNQQLIFVAWTQVMMRFERAMYENPDQDLNKLWWDLVEKYQMLRRPEGRNAPDYASKIHLVSAPAYYHNYTIGELFAAQLNAAIAREVLKTEPGKALYNEHKDVGEFLKRRVCEPARTMRWDEFVKYATGEKLSPKAFAAELSAG